MQVFLCWSGDASHKIASALHEFLGDVIQDIKPFLSSENIRKGARWRDEIGKKLAEINYGILCLTKDNLNAPWILFEAGALSKNIAEGHVTALLTGIQPSDVIEPLSQFQAARNDKDNIWKLVRELNVLIAEPQRLDLSRLERAFSKHWPEFETRVTEAMKAGGASAPAPTRKTEDMISEVLELVREMKREIGNPLRTGNIDYVTIQGGLPGGTVRVPLGDALAGSSPTYAERLARALRDWDIKTEDQAKTDAARLARVLRDGIDTEGQVTAEGKKSKKT